jgi:hypothetical protein
MSGENVEMAHGGQPPELQEAVIAAAYIGYMPSMLFDKHG